MVESSRLIADLLALGFGRGRAPQQLAIIPANHVVVRPVDMPSESSGDVAAKVESTAYEGIDISTMARTEGRWLAAACRRRTEWSLPE
jgi:hypothetical protein